MTRIILFALGICVVTCGPSSGMHRAVPLPAFAPSPSRFSSVKAGGHSSHACASSHFLARFMHLSTMQMSSRGSFDESDGTATKGKTQPPLSGAGRRIGGLRGSIEDVKKSAGRPSDKEWDGRVAANNRKEAWEATDQRIKPEAKTAQPATKKVSMDEFLRTDPAARAYKEKASKETLMESFTEKSSGTSKKSQVQDAGAGKNQPSSYT
jgi:hypothetical protein